MPAQKVYQMPGLGEKAYNPNKLCLHFLRGMYILMRIPCQPNTSNPNNHEASKRNQLHSQR